MKIETVFENKNNFLLNQGENSSMFKAQVCWFLDATGRGCSMGLSLFAKLSLVYILTSTEAVI